MTLDPRSLHALLRPQPCSQRGAGLIRVQASEMLPCSGVFRSGCAQLPTGGGGVSEEQGGALSPWLFSVFLTFHFQICREVEIVNSALYLVSAALTLCHSCSHTPCARAHTLSAHTFSP